MKIISTAPPEHLIKLMPTEAEQYAYCKSIGCFFECEFCVGYSESIPPYKKETKKHPKKAKIIKTKVEVSKFDNLVQNIAKTKKYGDFDHPLWEIIIEKFTKG
tara:strand:- start:36 stop:344 length:309 start_codon:yes stop_codon:yes gene_type:complete